MQTARMGVEETGDREHGAQFAHAQQAAGRAWQAVQTGQAVSVVRQQSAGSVQGQTAGQGEAGGHGGHGAQAAKAPPERAPALRPGRALFALDNACVQMVVAYIRPRLSRRVCLCVCVLTELMGDSRARKVVEALARGDVVTMRCDDTNRTRAHS